MAAKTNKQTNKRTNLEEEIENRWNSDLRLDLSNQFNPPLTSSRVYEWDFSLYQQSWSSRPDASRRLEEEIWFLWQILALRGGKIWQARKLVSSLRIGWWWSWWWWWWWWTQQVHRFSYKWNGTQTWAIQVVSAWRQVAWKLLSIPKTCRLTWTEFAWRGARMPERAKWTDSKCGELNDKRCRERDIRSTGRTREAERERGKSREPEEFI